MQTGPKVYKLTYWPVIVIAPSNINKNIRISEQRASHIPREF